MTDEVKKLLEQANEVKAVPFEPPLNKAALMKVRSQVSARIKFYKEMSEQGFPIHVDAVASADALVQAIDIYLWIATAKIEPEPSPEEWWASVLDEAKKRRNE